MNIKGKNLFLNIKEEKLITKEKKRHFYIKRFCKKTYKKCK